MLLGDRIINNDDLIPLLKERIRELLVYDDEKLAHFNDVESKSNFYELLFYYSALLTNEPSKVSFSFYYEDKEKDLLIERRQKYHLEITSKSKSNNSIVKTFVDELVASEKALEIPQRVTDKGSQFSYKLKEKFTIPETKKILVINDSRLMGRNSKLLSRVRKILEKNGLSDVHYVIIPNIESSSWMKNLDSDKYWKENSNLTGEELLFIKNLLHVGLSSLLCLIITRDLR
ncbi:MAG: hypothetical protein ACTSX6_00645 [Candidatus Heimdallarchaeaceae archaeon]